MSVFALPPGVDFAAELIAGLDARHPDPVDLAQTRIIVNTRRMERRLSELYARGPARLLPRIDVVTDLPMPPGHPPLPRAVPALRRRLDVIDLVARLLEAQPGLAPRASLYDLSDSLIALMDEMQGEGVTTADIAALDISDQSGHWARAQQFFGIVSNYLGTTSALDPETRQVRIVDAWIAHWQGQPPTHPVYLAGSTGSRGTTHRLMQTIAGLPGCGVILPGFGNDQPGSVWEALENPLSGEDHPQYRYARLLKSLEMKAREVTPWTDTPPPDPARNRLVSLALRPAPVTDEWRREGPRLDGVATALDNVTLIEAPSPRDEAQAIALRLRFAVEQGRKAALITPDRMLTRRVAAALDRWHIIADDSAGLPLHLSPPGRLLRHVADLSCRPLTVETLLTVLKHPLTHSGADRGPHQRRTRDLELYLRRKEVMHPDRALLMDFATARDAVAWGDWLCRVLLDGTDPTRQSLTNHVTAHHARAELLASGPDGTPDELWATDAGRKARGVMDDLVAEAHLGGDFDPLDYAALVHALLTRAEEVRDRDAPHPQVLIWGTLEARVQGADMVILGGLNDGSWPQAPRPDPWLNRVLRNRAGLLLPDRQIGLSAHDFQIAVAAPEVWLTRSLKSDDADTVPSRWLNRLANLTAGLEAQGGKAAWEAAKARGDRWLAQASLLDDVTPVDPAPRPAPSPPVETRPRELRVTDIALLRRDPYAIYARKVLGLKPLNPVVREPDARLRGTLVHRAMETFIKGGALTVEALKSALLAEMAGKVPWATTRAQWLAGIDRIADSFLLAEAARQTQATPTAFETECSYTFHDPAVTIKGRADRVDLDAEGRAILYDYKTGGPPKDKEQLAFERQLLIEAALIEAGAFDELGQRDVAHAAYLGLGSGAPVVAAPLGTGDKQETTEMVMAKLAAFLAEMFAPGHGFTARRAMRETRFEGDYDHLSRFGEWDHTTPATREDLT